MITVKANTTHDRREFIEQVNEATPGAIFDKMGVDVSNSMVCVDGAMITAADFGKTFAQLGVADGATVRLSAIVKAQGAR